jgi:hypothetical protein
MSARLATSRWGWGSSSEVKPARSLGSALLPLAAGRQCGLHLARQRRVRTGRCASLERSALRTDCPAILGLVARRRTRFAHFVRCAQTAATSQSTKRAARAATSPAILGAPEALRDPSGRAFAVARGVLLTRTTSVASRQALPGRGDLCGGEERRPSVGARSAHRRLTRRSCLSVVSAANAASSATRLKAEHRSEAGAQRRPTQHEPVAGGACRDAPKGQASRRERTAATSRKQVLALHASRVALRRHGKLT